MGQVTPQKNGGFLDHAKQMLDTHPGRSVIDRAILLDCIKACLDCAQACISCADSCVGESDPKRLVRCIRINCDCADICETTAKILSRQTALDQKLVHSIIDACETACRACAEECEKHGSSMQHCRVCAEACRACEQACKAVLAA